MSGQAVRAREPAAADDRTALSHELTSFVGRREELAAVRRLMDSSRLVTLTGPGGVGKTRLAFRLLAGDDLPGEVLVVELASLRDPALLVRTVATAAGLSATASLTPLELLVSHLSERSVLVYLDNCEHLLDACADLVMTMLRRTLTARFLTTSRQPLGVPGEHVLPVFPLAVPDAGTVRPGTTYDALVLFEDRARAVVPGFSIDDRNRAAVARVCAHLDGIPLAIELAAVRLRALAVPELAACLDDRFDLLTQCGRVAPERHQTLRATMDWSYDLCTPAEQLLWARASVFAGGFGLTAAEIVCADGQLPVHAILDSVSGLVEKSVLLRDKFEGHARFRVLETIREYGHGLLTASGEECDVRKRHLSWCQQLLEQAREAWFGPEQEQWSRRLRLEYPNLRTAFEFSLCRPGDEHMAVSMIGRSWFLWVCVLLAEGRVWLGRAAAADLAPTARRAETLAALGYVAALQGDSGDADELAAECARIAEALRDGRMLAYSRHIAGLSALFENPQRATELLAEAVDRYAAAGSERELWIGAEIQLGLAHILVGNTAAARRHFESCRDVCLACGERWEYSYALYGLGFAELADGHPAPAAKLALKTIEIKHPFDDMLGLSLTFDLLSWARAAEGAWEQAATVMSAAYESWASFGHQLFGSEHWLARRRACEQEIRAAIGDASFQTAFERGRSTTLDDFVAELLSPEDEPGSREPDPLTTRERQIAALVAEGRSNREIARTLYISQRTVEAHIEHAFTKLGFSNRAQLAAWVGARRPERARLE